jgi:hypothetical protein
MDRQTRRLAGCGLMFVLAIAGCKSTRSEVPPGRRYSGDGRQVPPVGFSSDPHPAAANGMGAVPGGPGMMPGQYGTPAPATPNYGAPTGHSFGPPGSAPTGAGPTANPLTVEPPTPLPQVGASPGAPTTNPLGVGGQPGESPSPH